MQGLHKGTEAMLLPSLLAAVPFVSTLLYVPRPKSSSMYLYALPPPHLCFLLFLSNCLTLSHKVLSETKRSHLCFLRWLLFFGCVSVLLFTLCIDSSDVFCQSFCIPSCMFMVFTQKCTPGCIKPQFKQTTLHFHPFHYPSNEGFTALFPFIYLFIY